LASNDTDVVITGAGAAGIAAGRRITEARLHCVVVEARSRLGGRAWTFNPHSACPIDLGCGWLHSADRNPWRELAEVQDRSIDKTPPPWMGPSTPIGFSPSEQAAFLQAHREFYQRLDSFPDKNPDVAAASFLEPLGRWNALINAVSAMSVGRSSIAFRPGISFAMKIVALIGGLWRVTER
jgi:monoamine oxidase